MPLSALPKPRPSPRPRPLQARPPPFQAPLPSRRDTGTEMFPLPARAAPPDCADRLRDSGTEMGPGHYPQGPSEARLSAWPPPTARAPAQGASVRGRGRARARWGPHARSAPPRGALRCVLREAFPARELSQPLLRPPALNWNVCVPFPQAGGGRICSLFACPSQRPTRNSRHTGGAC